jgi:hypothetical protein
MTAPTSGLGLTAPIPRFARSIALRIYISIFSISLNSFTNTKKAPNYKNIIQGLNKPISRAYAKYA